MWVIPRRFICSLSLAANEPPRNSPSVKKKQSERERVKQSWQSFRHNFTISPLTEITQSDYERVVTCFWIIEGVKRTCKQESDWNQWEEFHGGTYASEKIEATMENDTRRRCSCASDRLYSVFVLTPSPEMRQQIWAPPATISFSLGSLTAWPCALSTVFA